MAEYTQLYENNPLTGAQIQQYILNGAKGKAGLLRRFDGQGSTGSVGKHAKGDSRGQGESESRKLNSTTQEGAGF